MTDGKPYKIVHTYKHTEVVYYDADGEEVSRDERNDAWLYDSGEPVELTDQEIEDWM